MVSHFSMAHARIDHLFVSANLLLLAGRVKFVEAAWSDHMIVNTGLRSLIDTDKPFYWKLNESLLSDPKISDELSKKFKPYFALNVHPSISDTVLWAAHKATIKGTLTEMAARQKKAR